MKLIPAVLTLGPYQELHIGLMDLKFPWYYHPHQATNKDASYFYHTFHWSHNIQSEHFELIIPLIEFLKPVAIVNIRANLVVNRFRQLKSAWHTDSYNSSKMNHKTAIYYVTANNGYTELKINKKITKIPSVGNTMVQFDSNIKHRAVTQTNADRRVVININYYD